MIDGSNPSTEALSILLTATSTVQDEVERARLIATGIPSLLSCRVSGLALCGYSWTVFLNQQDVPLTSQAESITDPELDLIYSETRDRGQVTISRLDPEPWSVTLCAWLEANKLQSLTVFSLRTISGQIGMLLIGKDQPGGLSRDESLVCQTLAETLALGIENLRVTQNLERLVSERTESLRHAEAAQRALLKINNALVANLDRESLFDAISESLGEVVPFDRASLTLLDPVPGMIQISALTSVLGAEETMSVGTELPLEGSLLETVLRERRTIIRCHLDREPLMGEEARLLKLGIRSYVSVPLSTRDEPFGCLNVCSQAPDAYSEADAEFLAEVGAQVALAAENMLAFEKIDQLKAQLEQENLYLREEIKTEYNFHEIVGNSVGLKNQLHQVEQVAPTDATVLICGETGTGKELFARAIHDISLRKDRPLVKVNCAAISAGLVESELFGHEKGSFTGAMKQHSGRFELADGGTLFLDEVGELPMDTQVKLLRVLQEGEFERVGGNRPIQVDVRVIAATNRDLRAAIEAGEFRTDLFYRLNVFPIEVPPLRERKSDIPLLVAHLIGKLSRKLGKSLDGVSTRSMDRMIEYAWPGNVRELENVIERAAIVAPGSIIEIDDLSLPAETVPPVPKSTASETKTLEEVERAHILSMLEKTNWVISGEQGAATQLGINPNTLRSRIAKLGIKRSATAK